MGKTVFRTGCGRSAEQTGTGSQAHNGLIGRGGSEACYRKGQAKRNEDQGEMAAGKEACRDTYGAFLSALAHDFGRIRKTTNGTPSPQLYTYKKEK